MVKVIMEWLIWQIDSGGEAEMYIRIVLMNEDNLLRVNRVTYKSSASLSNVGYKYEL